jgi:AraC-like DNA-binding protein
MPLTPFARQPAELHATQASVEPAATSEATVGQGQISWQTARDRLIAIRRQGESFSSLRDLAARVGCSEGLIHKVIKQDVGMRAWAAEARCTRRTAHAATGDLTQLSSPQFTQQCHCVRCAQQRVRVTRKPANPRAVQRWQLPPA